MPALAADWGSGDNSMAAYSEQNRSTQQSMVFRSEETSPIKSPSGSFNSSS